MEREDIREVATFIEKGESAKTADRTEFQNLLYFLSKNKNKVDFVVVYKIDRWARNQSDFHITKAYLLKNGTNIYYLQQKT